MTTATAIAKLDTFVQHWTAPCGSADYMMTSEGLVLDNMNRQRGGGGYYHNGASTSESQVMMLRGYLRAYQATNESHYLTMARILGYALINYFFFKVIPSEISPWRSHWIVNGGTAFNSMEKNHESEIIAYGDPYECGPWRKLHPNEFATAGDSLHWFIETFDLFYLLETDALKNKWLNAKNSMFRQFQMISSAPPSKYKGAIPFEFSNKSSNESILPTAIFQGPYYAGYQNPLPWFFIEDYSAAANMLQFLIDAQTAYQQSTKITGPFAPVYHYDNSMLREATKNTFTWKGPDPNTLWGGFQYRPFAAVADFWQRCIAAKTNHQAVTSAEKVSTTFLTWLDIWLTDNPSETCIPSTFREGIHPSSEYQEPHIIALALKGALFCKKAGANPQKVTRVISKLYKMLISCQITMGDMAGSFSPHAKKHLFNGFWAGEIMDALALYKLLKE